jgi:hypothetical protein
LALRTSFIVIGAAHVIMVINAAHVIYCHWRCARHLLSLVLRTSFVVNGFLYNQMTAEGLMTTE